MKKINNIIEEVTQRIIDRSVSTREHYLSRMKQNFGLKVQRSQLSCTNIAHAIAAEDSKPKFLLKELEKPNIAILTAYNDMLSAHQPYYRYPEKIKNAIMSKNATAQVAGGVPAMCDGVTQGQLGMELSLFSRDVIALSSVIGLSHNVFDGMVCLGICDKIVPGLLMAAISFGYLPTLFIPSGPMASGISNQEKANTRKLYAEGKLGQEALLDSEMKSYSSAGTCTFYGTANSNQMLLEIMGLHIPGSAFISPNTLLRDKLTEFASQHILGLTAQGNQFTPLCNIISEKTIVNAMIGLIATGGSTNHTIHLPAIAKSAGIIINWDDFNELSKVIPLLAKVYPNGDADINKFHEVGGVAYIIRQLLENGLLHNDVVTVMGDGLDAYTKNPYLSSNNQLSWQLAENKDNNIIRTVAEPFTKEGGIKLITGNLGRAITKISAIKETHRYIKAPAKVFHSQDEVLSAYKNGELNKDVVVVLCNQGPDANGMPELHGLMPCLTSLQDQGFKVALVTDGRLSGASGKIPNAIHLTPSSTSRGGLINKLYNGDIIELDLNNGKLMVLIDEEEFSLRGFKFEIKPRVNQYGLGRELFANFRNIVTSAEEGATSIIY
jgi:phosphogluconate dehydratase